MIYPFTTSPTARTSVSCRTMITWNLSEAAILTDGTAGSIVDEEGNRLGGHQGIEGFTIGQRRGLGIAVGSPRYVVQIDPQTRTVTVAPASRSTSLA